MAQQERPLKVEPFGGNANYRPAPPEDSWDPATCSPQQGRGVRTATLTGRHTKVRREGYAK